MIPDQPMGFTLLRVPFFLEPDYPTDPSFEETNRVRLIRKWGGKAGWERQKARHGLKERGQEVGIEKFNLDRVASNTLMSHRLVQWVTKTLGINAAETLCNLSRGSKRARTRCALQAPASLPYAPCAAACMFVMSPPARAVASPRQPAEQAALRGG